MYIVIILVIVVGIFGGMNMLIFDLIGFMIVVVVIVVIIGLV